MSSTTQIRQNPGCLIQLLWFIFIGWWAGQLWILASWIMMITIIGLPLGVMMVNRLPQVIALHPPSVLVANRPDGQVVYGNVPQISLLVRIPYLILIGWWLSALWMELGYLVCLTFIGLPVGVWMIDQAPALLSLHRR